MAIHHAIKPHHHASIWAIGAMAVLASSLVYTNSLFAQTGNSSGPSQKAKDFFGAGGGSELKRPKICEDEAAAKASAASSAPDTSTDGQRQALVNQRASVETQIIEAQDRVANLGADDPERVNAQAALSAAQASFDAINAQIAALPQSQSAPRKDSKSDTFSPDDLSDECKREYVRAFRTEKKEFRTTIKNNIIPTFSKVAASVETISAKVDELEAAGVQPEKIAQLKELLKQVAADTATLKAFMADEETRIAAFPSDAEPVGTAYESMINFDSSTGKISPTTAAKAADRLVDNLTVKLPAALDSL